MEDAEARRVLNAVSGLVVRGDRGSWVGLWPLVLVWLVGSALLRMGRVYREARGALVDEKWV